VPQIKQRHPRKFLPIFLGLQTRHPLRFRGKPKLRVVTQREITSAQFSPPQKFGRRRRFALARRCSSRSLPKPSRIRITRKPHPSNREPSIQQSCA
jgi:hypothetical protein